MTNFYELSSLSKVMVKSKADVVAPRGSKAAKGGGVVFRTIAKKQSKRDTPQLNSSSRRSQLDTGGNESFHIVKSHNNKKKEAAAIDNTDNKKRRKRGVDLGSNAIANTSNRVRSNSSSNSSSIPITATKPSTPRPVIHDHNFTNNQGSNFIFRDRKTATETAAQPAAASRQYTARRLTDSNVPKPRFPTRSTAGSSSGGIGSTNININSSKSSNLSTSTITVDSSQRKKRSRFSAFESSNTYPPQPSNSSTLQVDSRRHPPQFDVWREVVTKSSAEIDCGLIEDIRTDNYNIFKSRVRDLKAASSCHEADADDNDAVIDADVGLQNEFESFDEWVDLDLCAQKKGLTDSGKKEVASSSSSFSLENDENDDNSNDRRDSEEDEVAIDVILSSLGGMESLLLESANLSLENFTKIIRLERLVEMTRNIDRIRSKRNQLLKALFSALRDVKFGHTTSGGGVRYPFRQQPTSTNNSCAADSPANGKDDADEASDDVSGGVVGQSSSSSSSSKYTTRRVTGSLNPTQRTFAKDMVYTLPRDRRAGHEPPKVANILGACLTKHVPNGSFVSSLRPGTFVEFTRLSHCWEVGVVLRVLLDFPSARGGSVVSSAPVMRHVKVAPLAPGPSVRDSCYVQVEDGRIAPLGTHIATGALTMLGLSADGSK